MVGLDGVILRMIYLPLYFYAMAVAAKIKSGPEQVREGRGISVAVSQGWTFPRVCLVAENNRRQQKTQ